MNASRPDQLPHIQTMLPIATAGLRSVEPVTGRLRKTAAYALLSPLC
jgi:hypothetical protein